MRWWYAMDDQEREHLLKLQEIHTQRLHALELHAAREGHAVDPRILNEIEDIRAKKERTDDQLDASAKRSIPLGSNQMSQADRDHLFDLQEAHTRRLQRLEIQAAQAGNTA